MVPYFFNTEVLFGKSFDSLGVTWPAFSFTCCAAASPSFRGSVEHASSSIHGVYGKVRRTRARQQQRLTTVKATLAFVQDSVEVNQRPAEFSFFVVIDARSRYRTGSIRGSRSRPNEIRSRDRRRWAYHERLQLPGRKKTHFRVGEEAVRILVCRPLGSALGRTPTWPVHGVYGG